MRDNTLYRRRTSRSRRWRPSRAPRTPSRSGQASQRLPRQRQADEDGADQARLRGDEDDRLERAVHLEGRVQRRRRRQHPADGHGREHGGRRHGRRVRPVGVRHRLARVARHRLRQCGPRPDLHDRVPPQRRRPERGGSHRARVRRAAGRWRRLRRQRGAVAVMSALRSHLSYANAMASVAVFVALGGASYAAVSLPRDSVGTRQLREHAVTHSKLAAGSVDTGQLRDDSVEASKLAPGGVKKHSLSPWIRDQLGRRAARDRLGPRGRDRPSRTGRRAGSLFAGRERHAESRDGPRHRRPVVQRELRGQRRHDHPELRRALEPRRRRCRRP